MAFRTTGFVHDPELKQYSFVDYDEPAKTRTTIEKPYIVPPEQRAKAQKKGPELSLFDRWTSAMGQQIDRHYDNETARLQRMTPPQPRQDQLDDREKQELVRRTRNPNAVTEFYEQQNMAQDQWRYANQAGFEKLESSRSRAHLDIRKRALDKALALEKAILFPKKTTNDFQVHKDAGESIKIATQMYEADAIPFVGHQKSWWRSRESETENLPLVVDEEMAANQSPEYIAFGRAMADLWNVYYSQSNAPLSEVYNASHRFRVAYTTWQQSENLKSASRTRQENMQLPMDVESLINGR